MNKLSLILIACGVLIIGFSSLAGAQKRNPNRLIVKYVLGPEVSVPPALKPNGPGGAKLEKREFRKAFAVCPRGYTVLSGGMFNGAITEIASAPSTNRRGWFVDGYNPSATTTFKHRTVATCLKGNPRVPVGIRTPQADPVDAAEAEALEAAGAAR